MSRIRARHRLISLLLSPREDRLISPPTAGVEHRALAAALPVAAEQAPFLGVKLLAEQLGIAADVAVELGERLGDVLQDRAFGLLGRDEPQHQGLIDLGERAIRGPLVVDEGEEREQVLDHR
jgi:hypothetical protein